MKRIFLLTSISLGLVVLAKAQNYKWEFGFFAGGSNFQGDVVKPDFFHVDETNLAVGLNLKRNLSESLSLKGSAVLRNSPETTQTSKTRPGRRQRAFRSRSKIIDISVQAQWELFGGKRYNEYGKFQRIFSPYLFAGTGVLITNTEADFSRTQFDLSDGAIQKDLDARPSKLQITVPIGGGIRLDLNKRLSLDLEGGIPHRLFRLPGWCQIRGQSK